MANSDGVGWLTKDVAGILRAKAARRNVPQWQLAEAAGVSQSQVSKMLRGLRSISIDQLDTMCDLLHLDLTAVIEEADANMATRTTRDPVFMRRRPVPSAAMEATRKKAAELQAKGVTSPKQSSEGSEAAG